MNPSPNQRKKERIQPQPPQSSTTAPTNPARSATAGPTLSAPAVATAEVVADVREGVGDGECVTVVGSTTVVGGSGVELYTVEPGASTTTVECAVTVSCSVTGTLTVTGTCSVMVTGMTVVMVWTAVLTRVMLLGW